MHYQTLLILLKSLRKCFYKGRNAMNFQQVSLTWTFRLFRLNSILSVIFTFIIGYLALYAGEKKSIFLLGAVFSSFLGVSSFYLEKKMKQEKIQDHWILAKFISFFSLFSPFFPVALLAIQELSNSETRKNYYKKIDLGPKMLWEKVVSPFSSENMKGLFIYGFFHISLMIIIFSRVSVYLETPLSNYEKMQIYKDPNGFISKINNPKKLNLLGEYCLSNNDYEIASNIYKKLLKFDSENKKYMANLAVTLSKKGNHKMALNYFEKYFSNNKTSTAKEAFAYAETLSFLNKKEEAINWYQKILEVNFEAKFVARKIVSLLIQENRKKEAQSFISDYISKNPSAVSYFNSYLELIKRK